MINSSSFFSAYSSVCTAPAQQLGHDGAGAVAVVAMLVMHSTLVRPQHSSYQLSSGPSTYINAHSWRLQLRLTDRQAGVGSI